MCPHRSFLLVLKYNVCGVMRVVGGVVTALRNSSESDSVTLTYTKKGLLNELREPIDIYVPITFVHLWLYVYLTSIWSRWEWCVHLHVVVRRLFAWPVSYISVCICNTDNHLIHLLKYCLFIFLVVRYYKSSWIENLHN